MLSLSQTTGYAIQALGCINGLLAPARQIGVIAKCSGVPRPYLAKIIGALSRKGLVATKRGFRGGISLTRPARDISLLEIVEAVEGEQWLGNCMLGFTDCAHHFVCPTQVFWERIRGEITAMLRQTSLADLLTARAEPPARATARPSAARALPNVVRAFPQAMSATSPPS
jgi:Rrf2 family transcriptional regulator, iron-sulfur cluster assembly transcription factor